VLKVSVKEERRKITSNEKKKISWHGVKSTERWRGKDFELVKFKLIDDIDRSNNRPSERARRRS
jgi:hypothetical protein